MSSVTGLVPESQVLAICLTQPLIICFYLFSHIQQKTKGQRVMNKSLNTGICTSLKWILGHIIDTLFYTIIFGGSGLLLVGRSWTWLNTVLHKPLLEEELTINLNILVLLAIGSFVISWASIKVHGRKRIQYYKYCPTCNRGIDAKNPENYCFCGIKYFKECPDCKKKITRNDTRYCSYCGYEFPRTFMGDERML